MGTLSRPTLAIMQGYLREGRMATVHNLREAIMEGAVQRVRLKMMTALHSLASRGH